MDRLIAANSVNLAGADVAPGAGTPQYATNGNPALNIPATKWPAYQYNALQEEILNVITAAGLTPDRTNNGQLLAALRGGVARYRALAQLTFYISNTGNDGTGNGTAGAPWATLAHALSVAINQYDHNGTSPIIQLANGTYAGFNIATFPIGVGSLGIQIIGNAANDALVTINGNCSATAAGMVLNFSHITMAGNDAGLSAARYGVIFFQNMIFGQSSSYQISADLGGNVQCNGNYAISGGGVAHMFAGHNSVVEVQGYACVLSNTPAYSSAFAQANSGGTLDASAMTYSGTGATGTRYNAGPGALIATNAGATYFPGNSAGVLIGNGYTI